MRCNQVSIIIERFGEYVPKDYPGNVQRISVYCDDFSSVYAALAKANAMAINELNEYESIGARSYVCTNEYSKADYREMHGKEPIEKSSYDDDLDLQFTYKSNELRKDRIWIHENIAEIIKLICSVEDKKNLKIELKEKFGLSDFQIKKLLSVRLDMLSKGDYLDDIEKDKEYEKYDKDRTKGLSKAQQIHWHEGWLRKAQNKLNEYNAYITIAENYQDMIKIISDNPDYSKYAEIMKEKYGFDRGQAGLVKLMTVEDLLSVDKFKEKAKEAEKEVERYKKWIKELT